MIGWDYVLIASQEQPPAMTRFARHRFA